jgi:hypothetical protein
VAILYLPQIKYLTLKIILSEIGNAASYESQFIVKIWPLASLFNFSSDQAVPAVCKVFGLGLQPRVGLLSPPVLHREADADGILFLAVVDDGPLKEGDGEAAVHVVLWEKGGNLGRDSPIVKHYSLIKNSCFVTCVNSALCS